MTEKEIKIFVEDLEEIVLRLHTSLRDMEERHDQFRKKPLFRNRKKFEKNSRWYVYYQGKFYAYLYTLSKLGSDVPRVLYRLRGIEMTSADIWETKAHYTEVYGHFPTEWLLRNRKVKK